ncbi:MAG: hypothetical protein H7333_00470, partial [Bdellovibrionales bacterium]|nr:hypothetical protein [Oligoflexia bacterium]
MSAQKILFFMFLIWVPHSQAGVVLPGDEITLPPLLNQVGVNSGAAEDRLNVLSVDQRKRQASLGEWLDFGDSLDLPGRISVQIIQKENFMWVGGGVFQGKIGSGTVVKDDLIYDLILKRGWMKVWIEPRSDHSMVKIHTDHGVFSAQDAEFWISTRPAQAEIYLIRGEVKAEAVQTALNSRTYAVFEKGKDKARYLAKDWDPGMIEVKIAASYEGLVRLAGLAQREWEAGKTSRTYASFRKKG